MSAPLHASTNVIDPVCGMTVNPERAAGQTEYKGQTYYFCAKGCLERFRADPERFLNRSATPAAPARHDVEYTCPMHPQVRQWSPGSCPICGMALEPVTITAHEEANPELPT